MHAAAALLSGQIVSQTLDQFAQLIALGLLFLQLHTQAVLLVLDQVAVVDVPSVNERGNQEEHHAEDEHYEGEDFSDECHACLPYVVCACREE